MTVDDLLYKHQLLNLDAIDMSRLISAYDVSIEFLDLRLCELEKKIPAKLLSEILKSTPESIRYI